MKAFAHSPTATEQLTVTCDKWERDIDTWAKFKVVQDAEKPEENIAKKKRKKMARTILLTKNSSVKEKALQAINYLQSLPYYQATE